MAEDWGYENMWGASPTPYWEPDVYAGGSPTFNEGGGSTLPTTWEQYNAGGYAGIVPAALASRPDLYGPGAAADYLAQGGGYPTGGGDPGGGFWGSLGNLLLGAGGAAAGAAGGSGGGGILGPLLSSLGSLGGGAIGSNAANEAARLQSQALNRGIDLQTAQWLQQQQNLAPYLQAGQGGLAQLQQLAGREQPGLPGQMASIDPRAYGMPDATPRWTPQGYQGPANVNAGDYRWNPQAGPQAANYRYTPGDIPQASQYRYTPGAVPTLSGQELLANDPGVAFRLAEGRKALESSAAARGGLLSGPTLAALQRQGQELSSQEYSNAFARAAQQAQMREQWGQQASAQNFGQAMSAAQLREQVNQIASQQGWSQAQAEAAFREQQAQLASSQGWTQALQGQQTGFNQGLESQKWLQGQNQLASDQLYNRNWDQYKATIGMDQARNETDYTRQQAAYRQQLAQYLLPWEQASTLANLGGQATSMYGTQGGNASRGISDLLSQLGTAQGQGAAGQGLMWNRALTGATNQVPSLLAGLNA